MTRIFLSPPHMSGMEEQFVHEAFESNWIAPLGPQVDAFEREFAQIVGAKNALALSSGTAALHLALLLAGVGPGDEVLVSTLTFAASVWPVNYLHAKPTFVDSEQVSWNISSTLLARTLENRKVLGRLPKAVIVVHLYGQSADLDTILDTCKYYNVPVIEDAAEALGASYRGCAPGTFGKAGIFSFNGNKIITTSGGGMLVSNDDDFISHARKLASQAREPASHYEHCEVGYNYRLSNVLAAIGRAQLQLLGERVAAKRRIFDYYVEALAELPGISLMPEAPWGRHNRWLTVMTVDPSKFGADRETVRLALEAKNIESRPVWKPMHLQPVFRGHEVVGGSVSESIFREGLCLPSGTALSDNDLARVVEVIRSLRC